MSVQLSLVIPTYNSAGTIRACLESLQQQSYKDFEIIIVDDGSFDQTQEQVKQFESKFKLKKVKQQHLGPAHARNNGAVQAEGNILVFVDADMTFAPDFLEKLTAPIRKKQTKGTFTKDEYVANWEQPWARFWNFQYTGINSKRRVPPNHPEMAPVFRAILKTEFDKVHGFDATGYTDDWTLSQKLGYQATNAPGAKMYHKNPATLEEVIAQAVWIGKRQYKLGELGRLWALFRANPLFSLIIGLYGSLKVKNLGYLSFKFVYNAGITGGILMKWSGQNSAK